MLCQWATLIDSQNTFCHRHALRSVRGIEHLKERTVLGLTLQDDCKYSAHVRSKLWEANKCLFIIRSIRRERYQTEEDPLSNYDKIYVCATGLWRGEEQGNKSPFSLLSEPISPSSLLFEPISLPSLNVYLTFSPSSAPPYFFPLFFPPPNLFFFGPFLPPPYSVSTPSLWSKSV